MAVNYKTKHRSKRQAQAVYQPKPSLELKEPSATYFVRNTEIPEFFGQRVNKG
jgi:hypothetical protein